MNALLHVYIIFIFSRMNKLSKDRTTGMILPQSTQKKHVARQWANANQSIQHLHTLSWGLCPQKEIHRRLLCSERYIFLERSIFTSVAIDQY